MVISPTNIQILFTNYDIITYFLNLASCSEHFISIKHRILATFNINKKNQSERLYTFKRNKYKQGLKNPLARRPGLVISTFGLAEIISCMPDGLVKKIYRILTNLSIFAYLLIFIYVICCLISRNVLFIQC